MKILGAAIAAIALMSSLCTSAEAAFIGIDGPDTIYADTPTDFTITYSVQPSGGPNFDQYSFYIQVSDSSGGGTSLIPIDFSGSFIYTASFSGHGTRTIDASMTAVFDYFSTNIHDDQSTQYSKQIDVLPTPIPGALPLFVTALGALGFATRRLKSAS